MKRWLLPLMLTLAWITPAAATDYPLDANLISPGSSVPWINIDNCEDDTSREALELRLGWALGDLFGTIWTTTLEADVFLSTSESCGSVAFEIGQAEGNGDVTIEIGQEEGQYPVSDLESYTLLDLIDDSDFDCASTVEDDYYLCIKWEYTYTVVSEVTDVYYGAAPIRIDLVAPDIPTGLAIEPGERNLKVSWDKPDNDDLGGYVIYWRVDGSDGEWDYEEQAGEDATAYTITGLTNGTTYEVEVAAYDAANNEGLPSVSVTETPVPIEDFYEYYRGAEGGEDGGFCFVATAAYGAYGDAMVRELRGFRDEVLAESEAGRGFIAGYYRFGPRWARAIRHDPAARAVAKTGLLPAVGLASLRHAGPAEWLLILSGLGLLVWLAIRFRRWLTGAVRRASVAGLALAIGLGALATSPRASAQGMPEATTMARAEPQFQLQVRLGPYYPSVDSEKGLIGDPFKDIFGSKSELLFEFDLDYEIWRGFGVFTAGASFGFVQFLGKGRTESGAKSSDTTVLNLVPLRLTVGYHFTKLDEWWDVPIVPYVQGGLSYYIWWVTDGVGDIAKWSATEGGSSSEALGGIFGLHLGAGVKLLLDWMDPDAAAGIENELGVINTFLFVEYNYSWVDGLGIGDHLSLGDDTFMFGLMFEF